MINLTNDYLLMTPIFFFYFREIIGAFVYNIVVPDSNEDIEIEIFSGQYLNRISWSGDGIRVIPSPHQ